MTLGRLAAGRLRCWPAAGRQAGGGTEDTWVDAWAGGNASAEADGRMIWAGGQAESFDTILTYLDLS